MPHPCLSCGACCASFRVALHWSEAEPALGGVVPRNLVESLRMHELAMLGTSQANPRCIALDARIGHWSRCSIYPLRPGACRDVVASWESGAVNTQCDRARRQHGLAALTPQDWLDTGNTPGSPRDAWSPDSGEVVPEFLELQSEHAHQVGVV
jgi:Fe-S-cluster containining protein